MTELNDVFKNSMSNSWSKQAYLYGLDYGCITCKNDDNMFERVEIVESI